MDARMKTKETAVPAKKNGKWKKAFWRVFRKENVLPALICLAAAVLFWLYVQWILPQI